jgi:phosphonate transport system substrate-binding protein
MNYLKLASCMAENSELFCQAVADYIDEKLGIRTEYVTGIPWQERERLFDQGEIHILWLCGLPYVDKADLPEASMELLTVPVPVGNRYHGRPVYFSDVIVREDSPFHSFAELRGASWVYNEPRSHSGYNVVRARLATRGESRGFFGAVFESGAHTASLEMILQGSVDGSAIDTTVLEWLSDRRPEIRTQVRVVETLGPSPMPPWVVSTKLPEGIRADLRQLLIDMDRDGLGQRVLAGGRIERFVVVEDRDYDSIREMARRAERVSLSQGFPLG